MRTLLSSILRKRKPRPLVRETAALPDVDALRRDLSLAIEHLTSIRCLLEISREYQQPIPTAALKNLELVSKQLCEIRQRFDCAAGGAVSAVACRPEPPPLPHPRPLSGECHTSPSGK